jgi:hypothetical protein
MGVLKKVCIGAVICVLVGIVIYEGNEISKVRAQADAGRKERVVLADEIARLKMSAAERTNKTDTGSATNAIQLRGKCFRRATWSDKGTGDPLDTLVTMFWTMTQGDKARLQLLTPNAKSFFETELLAFPEGQWNDLSALQIVRTSKTSASSFTKTSNSSTQYAIEYAVVEAVVERRLPQGARDLSVRSWTLTKTDGQWLVSDGH